MSNDIADEFARLYYTASKRTWENTYWLGVRVMKLPLDLWIYQEILHETRPDVVIETGTFHGGSASFMACVQEAMNHGRVISIDVTDHLGNGIVRPISPRIRYLTGSSTSDRIVNEVKKLIRDAQKVMVILDSDHSRDHVLRELQIYGELVTEGCYLIVEDSNVNGHPVMPEFGPGPMEAIDAFLNANKAFLPDRTREKYFFTFNPKGYLKKKRVGELKDRPPPKYDELGTMTTRRSCLSRDLFKRALNAWRRFAG
ncbi:MAG: CmcI family methyltransferase [Desulfomonilaceae bacterium]